jgi:hypothetical protein
MRELPDREPTAALSTKLLHAAAQGAAGATPRSSTSLFAPVARHPAIAAVATLVLVAGVGGALLLRAIVENGQRDLRTSIREEGERGQQRASGAAGGGARGASTKSMEVTTAEPGLLVAPTTPKIPPPAPPVSPAAAPPGESPATNDDENGATRARRARALLKKAVDLARREDCHGVAALGSKVRALDTFVYDTEFIDNAALAPCRGKNGKASF